MTAPDRIWAWTSGQAAGIFDTSFHDNVGSATEYIRADLAAVQPAQVRVKPLVWQHEARNGWKVGVAWATGYHIIRRDDGWHYGNGAGGVFPSIEAAKSAAQADYEARILAALEQQPDPRDEVIARLAEATEQFLIEYDEVDLAVHEPKSLTDAVYEARAALAAAKAVQK